MPLNGLSKIFFKNWTRSVVEIEQDIISLLVSKAKELKTFRIVAMLDATDKVNQ